MDESARKDWEKDPKAYARRAGLRGRDANFLAGLTPAGVGYYAERRLVDRWSFLANHLPRATALARRHGCLEAYFRAEPYPIEDDAKESLRFARWTRQASPGLVPCILPDLAAYEAAVLRLRAMRTKKSGPIANPTRAPGVLLLAMKHDLGSQLHARRIQDAPHVKTWMALTLLRGKIEQFRLERSEYFLARLADGHRSQRALLALTQAATGVPTSQLRRSLADLREAGLVTMRVIHR